MDHHEPATDPGAEPRQDSERVAEPRSRRARVIAAIKSASGNVLLLLGSLLFTLILAEVAIRMVSPQQLIVIRGDVWMPVDTLGWKLRPNIDTRMNTGEREVRLLTDAEGFRVGERGRREAPDSILLIGDSFMEALQVEHEQSFAGLLEDSLAGPEGEGVTVRNTAVGSWDPPHYRLMAKRRLAEHRYDLVLVAVFVGNDLVLRTNDYFPPRPAAERARLSIPLSLSPRAWIEGVARPINDFLEVRSHLYVFIKSRTEPLRIRLGLTAGYMPRGVLKERADSAEWTITADLLEEIATAAAARDVPTLYVLIPERYKVDLDLFDAHVAAFGLDPTMVDLEQPNRLLYDELTARGLDVIDALPPFREVYAAGERPLYGSVDPHFSPEGHAALLRLLRPRLEEVLWGG